jgi:hypothetical protein
MPATLTELLPATKSSRHSAIRFTPGTFPGTGELAIDDVRSSTRYAVAGLPCEFDGRAARLVKLTAGTDREAEGYSVFCAAPGSRDHDSCECKGFYRHGRCKHVAALRAMLDNEWLMRSACENGEADASSTEVG